MSCEIECLESLEEYLKKRAEEMNYVVSCLETSADYKKYNSSYFADEKKIKELMSAAYDYISKLYNISKKDLREVKIGFYFLPNNIGGVYDPQSKTVGINRNILSSGDYNRLAKILIHELTHYVQHKKDIYLWNYSSYEEYLRNYNNDPNEIMARNTENLFFDYLKKIKYSFV